MNFKNIFTLVLVGGLFLISCKDKQKTSDESPTNQKTIEQKSTINTSFLIGSWKDQSQAALHFSLYADGTAQSDNMKTLLYQKWNVKGNQLYLEAKSIGNGSSSIDTEIYEIQQLDENQMILKRGEIIFEYKKINKYNETLQNLGNEALPEQKSKILSGKLTLGHEGRSFEPCGSDKAYWVSDKTGKLQKLYNELTVGKKPYTPIFAEIEFIDKGKAKEGFPADYVSVYEVVRILNTRKSSDKNCE